MINIVFVNNRFRRKVHQYKGPETAKHLGKVMRKVSGKISFGRNDTIKSFMEAGPLGK